ncbi:transporter substrate-binding domain-containing protein [Thalassomonas viridans]|uniref:Transporter substrate-binding domain-containing protein n=1 Tax=Thalassomonas viridans TaxID=137584 RepID=A0AAE9Z971_9GAMM|nr:transporter substrate-binding domain-containing protein [Thalassomonas viridans]WDE09086.1 transporter substrate-binding domain-containing protein [Thalassomonas viridans]
MPCHYQTKTKTLFWSNTRLAQSAFASFFLAAIIAFSHVTEAKQTQPAQVIDVLSSNWKPFVYSENGVHKGFAYDITKKVLDDANIGFNLYFFPWSRIYALGVNQKNYLIVGLARTKQREPLFHWIGPVAKPEAVYFYKLKEAAITINEVKDANRYIISTEKSTHYHNFLEEQEFTFDNILLVTRTEQIIKMLLNGRIDLILSTEQNFNSETERAGIDPALFEKVLHAYSIQEYMAFSGPTSPELYEKVQHSYHKLKNSGQFILR